MKSINCRPLRSIDRMIQDKTKWKSDIISTLRGMYENSIPGFASKSEAEKEEAYGEGGANIIEYYNKLDKESKEKFDLAVENIQKNNANKTKAVVESITYGQYTVLKNYIGKILNEFGALSLENIDRISNNANQGNKPSKDIMTILLKNKAYAADMQDIMGKTNVTYDDIKESHSARVLYNLACNVIISQAITDGNLLLNDFVEEVYNVYANYINGLKTVNDPKIAGELAPKGAREAIKLAQDFGKELFVNILTISSHELEQKTGIKWKKGAEKYDTADEELREESILESWMQNIDKSSTFSRSSSFIRLLCSLVPKFTSLKIKKEGKLYDVLRVMPYEHDFRMAQTWDAKKLYDAIHIAVRDVADANDMIKALRNSRNPSLKLIAEIADNSAKVKSELFSCMYSFLQEYSQNKVSRTKNGKIVSYVNKLLSNGANVATTAQGFKNTLMKKVRGLKDKGISIFRVDENDKSSVVINGEKFKNFYTFMIGSQEANAEGKTTEGALVKHKDGSITYSRVFSRDFISTNRIVDTEEDLKLFVGKINDYLNLGLTRNAIDNLATIDVTNFERLITQVFNLCESLQLSMATKGNGGKLQYRTQETYSSIFNTNNNQAAVECLETLLKITAEANDYCNMMVRDNNSKSNYAKDAKTSEFGRLLNTFRSFRRQFLEISTPTNSDVENKAKYTSKRTVFAEMREFLLNEYLTSSEFYIDAPISIIEDGKSVDYHIKDFINSGIFIQRAKGDNREAEAEIIKAVANNIINPWIKELFLTTAENYSENSFFNHLCNSGEKINSVEILYGPVLTEDMNEMQNVIAFINSFSRKERNTTNKGGSKYAQYAMSTMGDAQVIRTMETPVYDHETLISIFINIAKSEMARMNQERKIYELYKDKSVEEITANKRGNLKINDVGNFVYLPVLNNYKAEIAQCYNFDDTSDTYILNVEKFEKTVTHILFGEKVKDENTGVEYYLGGELANEYKQNYIAELQEKMPNLFETMEVKQVTDGNETYTTVFKNFPNISYESVFVTSTDENATPKFATDELSDLYMYYLNHKAAIALQLQFLHKNPGAYVASINGILSPSSVVQQKRFKGVNTPGDVLDPTRTWNGERMPEVEKVMYIKEFNQSLQEYNPTAYNNLLKIFTNKYGSKELAKKKLKDYLKAKATDGQGWRTLSSYRQVMIMAGKWNGKKEVAYNEVQKIRNGYDIVEGTNKKHIDGIKELLAKEYLTLEEKRTISKLQGELDRLCSGLFTPTKPHLSSYEKLPITEGKTFIGEMYVPVEHKYAEMILIPELYAKDNFLYHLGTYMEDNNIDMACSEECVKVGKWGMITVPQSSTDASIYDTEFSQGTVHTFKYTDMEIQTEVPPHMDTDQLMGTQMKKHILATIIKNGAYDLYSSTLGGVLKTVNVAGEKLDLTDPEHGGENLTKLYNALLSKKILDSFLTQMELISDPDKLADALVSMESRGINVSTEKLSRFATISDAESGKRKFAIPLSELSRRYDTESALMSILSKKVNKQKMRGGSLVQISAIGMPNLKTHFDENGNPTYCDIAATWDGSVIINGREVKLKYEDWVNYDGSLIMDNDESGEAVSLPVFQKAGRYNITNDPFIDFKDLKGYRHQVEVVYPEENNKNKVRIYIKNNGEVIEGKGYFEIIKDPEENDYSIYFKTGDANTGELFGSTKEERAILYEVAAKLLPNGAKLSTIASKEKGITKGGLIGLNKIGSMEGFSTINEIREGFMRGKAISKLEKAYPGILDRILYRIPTEKSYSILSGKITHFFPSYMGNVVGVPTEYMVAAGFDFDIDKLYYLKREYHIRYKTIEDGTIEKEDTDPLVMDIWNTIYSRKGKLGKTIGKDLRAVKITSDKAYNTERNKYVDKVINIIKKKYKDNKKLNSSEEELLTNLQEYLSKDLSEYNLKNKKDKKIINNALFVAFKDKIKRDIDNGQSTLVIPSSKLYPYWSKIYLNSTYQEAFDDYLIKHPDKAKRLNEAQRNNRLLEKKGVESLTLTHKERQEVHPLQDTQGTNTEDINLGDLSSWELDNMLFDIIKSRIEDPATVIDRYTPGGFPTGKEAALKMKAIKYTNKYNKSNIKDILTDEITEDYEPVYDLTNPYTIAIYNARNIVASKVIGIAANHSTNYAYSKTLGDVTLNTPITLFDKSLNDLNCKEGGWMLAEFLAASVDAVKAPVLNFLNINSNTANVAMLLGRAGFSMFEIGVFLNQPIIQKVIDSASSGIGGLQYHIRKVANEMFKSDSGKPVVVTSEMHKISTDELLQNLVSEPTENTELQKKLLSVLFKLTEQASALNDFVKNTKYTASNSIDNTVGSTIASYYSMIEYISRNKTNEHKEIKFTLNNGDELVNPIDINTNGEDNVLSFMRDKQSYLKNALNNPLGIEQTMFDCVRGFCEGLSNYFPYSTPLYDVTYGKFAHNSLRGELNSDIIGYINKELPLFLMSLDDKSYFNPQGEIYFNLRTGQFTESEPPTGDPFHTFTNIDLFGNQGTLSTTELNFADDYRKFEGNTYITEKELTSSGKQIKYRADIKYVIDMLNKIRTNILTFYNLRNIIQAAVDAKAKRDDNLPLTEEEEAAINFVGDNNFNNDVLPYIVKLRNAAETLATQLANTSIWFKPEDADLLCSDAVINNAFLESLVSIPSYRTVTDAVGNTVEVYDDMRFGIQNNLHFDKDLSPALTDGWASIHSLFPTFSKALYFTNYYTKGFSIGRSNFNNLISNNLIENLQVTLNTNYVSFLEGEIRGEGPSAMVLNNGRLLAQFMCNFYRLHNGESSLVSRIPNDYTSFHRENDNKYTYTDSSNETITVKRTNGDRFTVTIPTNSSFCLGIKTENTETIADNGSTIVKKENFARLTPAFTMYLTLPKYKGSKETIQKKMIFINSDILDPASKVIVSGEHTYCEATYEAFDILDKDSSINTEDVQRSFTNYTDVKMDDILRMATDSEEVVVNTSIDDTPMLSTREREAQRMALIKEQLRKANLYNKENSTDPISGEISC